MCDRKAKSQRDYLFGLLAGMDIGKGGLGNAGMPLDKNGMAGKIEVDR